MANVLDLTESLLDRTKKLLDARGDEMSLRQIAVETGINEHWLRSFSAGRADNPGVQRLEKLHNFLAEYHAARRFQQRQSEPRAN